MPMKSTVPSARAAAAAAEDGVAAAKAAGAVAWPAPMALATRARLLLRAHHRWRAGEREKARRRAQQLDDGGGVGVHGPVQRCGAVLLRRGHIGTVGQRCHHRH